ncbi:MAG: hypothetical protein JNM99_10625 [Verrucomicrobiaceae bacterium]|nr:hypothetical protein [Verrucomicrobiaceae bacterium]
MALGAEMSLESITCPPKATQEVLVNLEINDRCAFTAACGETCYLNSVHVDHARIPSASVLAAARAFVARGDIVRHLAIPGKEPFETPELLLEIARAFHATPEVERPASLGVISASLPGIQQWLPKFDQAPLCWLALSVDVEGSGLRAGDPLRVLDAAVSGRTSGGTKAVAVNTTFTAETLEAVVSLATRLQDYAIDQWAVCPLMVPRGLSMHSVVSEGTLERLVLRLGKLTDVAARVVVETDPDSLRRLVGETRWNIINTNVWRIEVLLPNGVWLFARTPRPGYFIRMRYDGELLSRQQFATLGVRAGRYGTFRSYSDVDDALERMRQERIASEKPDADAQQHTITRSFQVAA